MLLILRLPAFHLQITPNLSNFYHSPLTFTRSNFFVEFINENIKISISKHFICGDIEKCFSYLFSALGVIKWNLAFSQVLIQFTFLVPNSFMKLRQWTFDLIIFPKEFYDFPGWTVCVLILNPVFWSHHIVNLFFPGTILINYLNFFIHQTSGFFIQTWNY